MQSLTKVILFFCLTGFYHGAEAQINLSEKIEFPFAAVHYAYQIPGHDLAQRFGNNSQIGASFFYKFRSNLVTGVEGSFLFSENVRRNDQYLRLIAASDGNVISEAGTFAGIFFHQRGFNLQARVGGIIPIFGPNPNSGLLILGGAGMLQHKIRIEVEGNNVPQLRGDYRKGYDRLTSGPSISQYIGYVYFDNEHTINFQVGLEFTQAWTQSRRSFDFDRMQPDIKKRFESLWGVRIGWLLPLIKRAPRDYYYF